MKTGKHFIDSLNILDSVITYHDFEIDEDIAFDDQKYSYKLDMLQISFGNRFILDVGWQPDFNPKGYFVVRAVQDHEWLKPISKIKCRTLKTLKKAIEKTAALINEKQSENI